MATKAFTDIPQSKKLAEILPHESADMCYVIDYAESNKYGTDHFKLEVDTYGLKVKTRDNIPCWSLTSLLRVIPKRIKFWNALRIDITDEDFEIWYEKAGCEVNDELPHIIKESPVDASVETILKLHELKLL